jgi:hypothetical protein
MNERIRELVRQAGLDDADFPIENWDNVPLAKFAELIIEQCGIALSPMLRDMVSRGQAYDLIKQHFGVAE